MRGDLRSSSPSFVAYAPPDLSRPPLTHPIDDPVTEHLICLERCEVSPLNGDAKGVHNLCVDVVWLVPSLHGLFDVMLILDCQCPFLWCSGTGN